jgi:peptide chain release factor 2
MSRWTTGDRFSRNSPSGSTSSGSFFDVASKETSLAELREQAGRGDLWNDADKAQQVTRKLSRVEDDVERFRSLEQLARDLIAANELAVEHDDPELTTEVTEGLAKLQAAVGVLEIESMFSGELDDKDVIMAIHAGAGGTDSQDWAAILMRMYLRWGERNRFEVNVREALAGDEAGAKSVTLEIRGPHAYGWLQSEHGVHRLVRLSPFDSAHRRHTSFASVDVIPDLGDEIEVDMDEEDLRIDTFRAQGAGGQHVNTTDSAVRITHVPTGLAATCQSERSQMQNKNVAMKILKTRLAELRHRERNAELSELRGEQRAIDFGSQIRSYVQHPYQLVKDHRTNYETSSVDKVLDGELEGFMSGFLRWRNTN